MAHVIKTENGKWECRWSWYDADDKRHFQKRRFRTKAEADQHKRDLENRNATHQSVDHNPGKESFASWAERWSSSIEGKKKPSTLRAYRSIQRTTVLPHFGHRRIASITPADVDEWLTWLRTTREIAPPTIRRHYGVLRLILKYAARLGAIAQNPALDAELPTDRSTGRVKPTPVFLTAHEVEDLASQLPAPYDLLIRFLAYTGLRVAEASGLNVSDVNMSARRQVTVARTRTKVRPSPTNPEGWEVHVPKSGKPRRVPLLPRWLKDDMTVYLAEHPNGDDSTAPLFPGTTQRMTPGVSGSHRVIDWGKPWEPGTFYKRQYKPALVAAGLPRRTRLHDLRHTAASLMLATGIEPIWTAEYLGHTLQVLTTTYAHLLPDVVDAHAERFNGSRPARTPDNVAVMHP